MVEDDITLKPRNVYLYKYYDPARGTPTPRLMDKMGTPQWFLFKKEGRSSYGKKLITYKLKHSLFLMNLGSERMRHIIRSNWSLPRGALNPDLMYQGDNHNEVVHEELRRLFGMAYDGTIIDGDNPDMTEGDDSDDWSGPEEIVLWRNFTKNLKVYSITNA